MIFLFLRSNTTLEFSKTEKIFIALNDFLGP